MQPSSNSWVKAINCLLPVLQWLHMPVSNFVLVLIRDKKYQFTYTNACWHWWFVKYDSGRPTMPASSCVNLFALLWHKNETLLNRDIPLYALPTEHKSQPFNQDMLKLHLHISINIYDYNYAIRIWKTHQ